jgi:hypothetical protein
MAKKNAAADRIERRCALCAWRWFQRGSARYHRACGRCCAWRCDAPATADNTALTIMETPSAGGAALFNGHEPHGRERASTDSRDHRGVNHASALVRILERRIRRLEAEVFCEQRSERSSATEITRDKDVSEHELNNGRAHRR